MRIKRLKCSACKCKIEPFQEDVTEAIDACHRGAHCSLAHHPSIDSLPSRWPADQWYELNYPRPLEIHFVDAKQRYVIEK